MPFVWEQNWLFQRKKGSSDLTIRQCVRHLIQQWGTSDPLQLCECLHIHVYFCELPREVRGFYHEIRGIQILYINQELSAEEQREVCGHELGHAVLHRGINTLFLDETGCMNQGKFEREADLFCAELLVEEAQEGETAEWIAHRCGVSEQLVKLKYHMM